MLKPSAAVEQEEADAFEPEEMADILLLLKSGDVDIARHAWHSYMWSARLTAAGKAVFTASRQRPSKRALTWPWAVA